jgi:hypothetical protein
MFKKMRRYLWRLEDRQRINIALSKGALMGTRCIDLRRPETWEWSCFSQNGEDGIIDVLCSQLRESNRYFLEIGAADGIENNTAWLAVARNYGGLMVEGDLRLWKHARQLLPSSSLAVECLQLFVTRENAASLIERALFSDPDVCSIDIDGNDYYVAAALIDAGLRPKIFVVEYNSAYGPEQRLTIEYTEDLDFLDAQSGRLYYGVSIAAWKAFFEQRGYRFVTVDRNGVNAFFADSARFDAGFLDAIQGTAFAENRLQLLRFRATWQSQFALIKDQRFVAI